MHFLRCRCGVGVAVQRTDAPNPPDKLHSCDLVETEFDDHDHQLHQEDQDVLQDVAAACHVRTRRVFEHIARVGSVLGCRRCQCRAKAQAPRQIPDGQRPAMRNGATRA